MCTSAVTSTGTWRCFEQREGRRREGGGVRRHQVQRPDFVALLAHLSAYRYRYKYSGPTVPVVGAAGSCALGVCVTERISFARFLGGWPSVPPLNGTFHLK